MFKEKSDIISNELGTPNPNLKILKSKSSGEYGIWDILGYTDVQS